MIAISKEVDTATCVPWSGHIMQNGYGQKRWNGQATTAHRAVWQEAHGPIPDGLHVDHLCRNKACVNLDHLELVTQAENNRRAAAQRPNECPKGHGYTPENTLRDRKGGRKCAECNRAWNRAWRARQ